jgi:hypothetical protein
MERHNNAIETSSQLQALTQLTVAEAQHNVQLASKKQIPNVHHRPYGQHFFVHILCCIHIFCPQKTHNATLFYRGTCIQWRRHLVTAAMSVHSIKLDSAAI